MIDIASALDVSISMLGDMSILLDLISDWIIDKRNGFIYRTK